MFLGSKQVKPVFKHVGEIEPRQCQSINLGGQISHSSVLQTILTPRHCTTLKFAA